MRFGKITLPAAMGTLQADLSTWSVEGLERFLEVVKEGPVEIPVRAFGGISGLEDQNGSLLGFRYGDSCKFETRTEIENLVARYIEPKLTCAASQDKDLAQRLFAVFLQRPVLECKSVKPMTNAQCGMATLPVSGPFFLGRPKIAIDMRESCREGMSDLILHEIFHLVGARDNPSQQMDKYVELSESCSESSASLTFDNGERSEFLNSSQVETRMLLFRRVRDDAVSKWGWQSSEKDLVLGTICSHMGDRSCSRKFFEQAATGQLSGTVALPEGDTVSLSALAQYLFFDETTEDTFRMRNRMRELTKYLRRDPQGMLLKRNEYSGTRLHEYFVVRAALEKVKGNKNICDDNTDDRIYCEDLSAISQTPWFRNQ